MLLNMSLHLSDVNTEPVIQTQTYHALAEAYFNINEYERALNAGKNCFKLQSVKSKVHFEPFYYARTWDIRRQIEHLSSYAHVVETTAKLVISYCSYCFSLSNMQICGVFVAVVVVVA